MSEQCHGRRPNLLPQPCWTTGLRDGLAFEPRDLAEQELGSGLQQAGRFELGDQCGSFLAQARIANLGCQVAELLTEGRIKSLFPGRVPIGGKCQHLLEEAGIGRLVCVGQGPEATC